MLSDAMDPFNRTPLKEEELIPASDLKAKISAWKAEMHAQTGKRGAGD